MKGKEFETHIVTRKVLQQIQSPKTQKNGALQEDLDQPDVASPLSAHISKMKTQFKGRRGANKTQEESKVSFPYHSQEPILVKPKIRDILHGGTLDRVFSRAVNFEQNSRLACSDSITLPRQFLTYLEPHQKQMALKLFEQGLLLVQLNSTVSYFHHVQRQERERYKGQALPGDPSKLVPSTFAVNSPDYQLLKNRQKRLFCRVVKFVDQDLDEVHVPQWVLKHLDLQSGQPMCVQMFRNPGQLHFYDAKEIILEPKSFNYQKFVDKIQSSPEQFLPIIQKALKAFKTLSLNTDIDVRIESETVRFGIFQMHPAEQTVCFNGRPENLQISFRITEQLDREIQIHQLSTLQIQKEQASIIQQAQDLNSVIKFQGLNLDLLEQMSQEHENSKRKLKELARLKNLKSASRKSKTSILLPNTPRSDDRISDDIIDEKGEKGFNTGITHTYEDQQTSRSQMKSQNLIIASKITQVQFKKQKDEKAVTVSNLLERDKWSQGGRHKPIIQNDKESFLKSKNLYSPPKIEEQQEDSNEQHLEQDDLIQQNLNENVELDAVRQITTQPDQAFNDSQSIIHTNGSPITNQIYAERVAFRQRTQNSVEDRDTINLKQSIVTASINQSQLSNDPTRPRMLDNINYIASSVQQNSQDQNENADMTILVDEQMQDQQTKQSVGSKQRLRSFINNAEQPEVKNFKGFQSSLFKRKKSSSNSLISSEPQTALLLKKRSTQVDVTDVHQTLKIESLLQQTQKGKLLQARDLQKKARLRKNSQFYQMNGSHFATVSDQNLFKGSQDAASNQDLVDEVGMTPPDLQLHQNQNSTSHNKNKKSNKRKGEGQKGTENQNVQIKVHKDQKATNLLPNTGVLRLDKVLIQASQGKIRQVSDFQSSGSTSKQVFEQISKKRSGDSFNVKSNPEMIVGESGEEFKNILRVIDSCHPSQIKMINYKSSPRQQEQSPPALLQSPHQSSNLVVSPINFDSKYVLDQKHVLAQILLQQKQQITSQSNSSKQTNDGSSKQKKTNSLFQMMPQMVKIDTQNSQKQQHPVIISSSRRSGGKGDGASSSGGGGLNSQRGAWTNNNSTYHPITNRQIIHEDTFSSARQMTKAHTTINSHKNSPKYHHNQQTNHNENNNVQCKQSNSRQQFQAAREKNHSFQQYAQNALIPQDPYEGRRQRHRRQTTTTRRQQRRNQTQTYTEEMTDSHQRANYRKKAVPKSASQHGRSHQSQAQSRNFLLGGQLSRLLQKQNRMMFEQQRYAQLQSETNRSNLLLESFANEITANQEQQMILSELFDNSRTFSPPTTSNSALFTSRKQVKLSQARKRKLMQEVRVQEDHEQKKIGGVLTVYNNASQEHIEQENVRIPSTVLNYGHKEQVEPHSPSSVTTNGFRKVRGRDSQKSSQFQISKQTGIVYSPNVGKENNQHSTVPQTVFVHYGAKRNQTPNFQGKDSQISQNDNLNNQRSTNSVAINLITNDRKIYNQESHPQISPQNQQIVSEAQVQQTLTVAFSTSKILDNARNSAKKQKKSRNSQNSTNKTEEIPRIQTLKGPDEAMKLVNQGPESQIESQLDKQEGVIQESKQSNVDEQVDVNNLDGENRNETIDLGLQSKSPAFIEDQQQELLDLPIDSAQITNDRQIRKLTSERVIQDAKHQLRQEINGTKDTMPHNNDQSGTRRLQSVISDKVNFTTYANHNTTNQRPTQIDRFPIQPTQLSVEQIKIRKRLLPQRSSRSPTKDKEGIMMDQHQPHNTSSDLQQTSSALTKRKGFLTVLETKNINNSSDKASPTAKIPTMLKEYQISSHNEGESVKSPGLTNKVKWKIVKQKLHEPQPTLNQPVAFASSQESIHTHPAKKKKSNNSASKNAKNIFNPGPKIPTNILSPVTTVTQNGKRAKGLRTLTEATFSTNKNNQVHQQNVVTQQQRAGIPITSPSSQIKRLRSAVTTRYGKHPKIPKKFQDSFLKAVGYSKISTTLVSPPTSSSKSKINQKWPLKQKFCGTVGIASEECIIRSNNQQKQDTQVDEILNGQDRGGQLTLADSAEQISQGVQANLVTPKKASQNLYTESNVSQALAQLTQPGDSLRRVQKQTSSSYQQQNEVALNNNKRVVTRQSSPEFLRKSWDRMAAQKQKVVYPPSIPSRKLQEKLSSSVEDYNRGGRFSLTKNRDLILLPNQILADQPQTNQNNRS